MIKTNLVLQVISNYIFRVIKTSLIVWLIITFNCQSICPQNEAETNKEKPEIYLIDPEILNANKNRINLEDSELEPAFLRLLSMAEFALKKGPYSVTFKEKIPPSGDRHDYMSLSPYWWPDKSKPDGLPYIRKDGRVNPEVTEYHDKQQLVEMSLSAKITALAYYLTGEKKFAEYAADIIKTWFLNEETRMNPNFRFAQAVPGIAVGRSVGLIEARHFCEVIDAIGLIKNSEYWDTRTDNNIKQWFGEYFTWLTESELGKEEAEAQNNHGSWYDVQASTIALFLGKSKMAENIIDQARLRRIGTQIDQEGKQPHELARTRSLSYSAFNLEALFSLAMLGKIVKVDLWNYKSENGSSLKSAFDFLLPYFLEQKDWPFEQIRSFEHERSYGLLLQAENYFAGDEYKSACKQLNKRYANDINKILYKKYQNK